MSITITRHGKVAPLATDWIRSSKLGHWIDDYNTNGIADDSRPPADLRKIARNTGAIVCSNLRRSVDSAKLLQADRIALKSDLFSEAELPYTGVGHLTLPPGAWTALFRLLWMLGYSSNSESQTQAQARAKKATRKLIQMADIHQDILFVGHGIFNRMVVRELLDNGWKGSRNPSSAYWGYTVYEHPKIKPAFKQAPV